MKKVFTLMLVLFAMVAVQAQSLLSEDFENGIPSTWLNIDADNDSYAWMEGTAPGVSGHNSSNGCAYSCSYYDGTVLTPDNWLITPAVNLTSNATLTFWVAAQDASWAAEHYGVYISTTGTSTSDFTLLFEETIDANGGSRVQGTWKQKTVNLSSYTGQTVYIAFRHFNSTDMFYIDLDDVEITAQPTDPTISATPTSVNFVNVLLGNSQDATVNVTAYNLTNAVTATTAAPFSVSADGTTFDATASIDTAGGTLYVRYTPTAGGNDNGTVTISSTGATDVTVTLTGSCIDCSDGITTFPYVYDFNTGEYPPLCWGYNNAENYGQAEEEESDGYALMIQGVDMLVTPEINTNNPLVLMFDYASYLGEYAETPTSFRVGYSTTNNNVSSFTWQTPVTISAFPESAYFQYATELPAGTKYVAIDVTELGTYLYYGIIELSDAIYIDNFSLQTDATLLVSPESLSFGNMIMGSAPIVKTADVTAALLTSDIAVSAPANFEVSANGTSYAATATLPQAGGTLYVRYNPSALGSHSGNITLTSGNASKTIAVSGSLIDCSVPKTLPFIEDFDGGEFPPACWMVNSTSEYTWENDAQESGYSAYCTYGDQGIQQDENLITPTLNLSGYSQVTLTFQYMASSTYVLSDDPEESYTLYIYGSTDNGASFTNTPIFNLKNEDFESWTWTTATVDLTPLAGNANVKLNFNYYGMYGGELYVDDINITGVVGVNEFDNTVRVYPNPANNVLNINANSNINRVEVYNMMGQMVGMYNVNDMNTQINTTNFANGVYTVKIETENGTSTKKFMVAR
jgi:hypothetical protein